MDAMCTRCRSVLDLGSEDDGDDSQPLGGTRPPVSHQDGDLMIDLLVNLLPLVIVLGLIFFLVRFALRRKPKE